MDSIDRPQLSFPAARWTLLSAIYYVNSPATSATHTVTVQLSNPAPLVFHVFAVSGSDVTGPPIFSAITDPGAGRDLGQRDDGTRNRADQQLVAKLGEE